MVTAPYELSPDLEKLLRKKVLENFTSWTNYSVCYNALDFFVCTLPPEDALDAVQEILQRPMCYGALLVPDALGWLYLKVDTEGLRDRIRETTYMIQGSCKRLFRCCAPLVFLVTEIDWRLPAYGGRARRSR